VTIFVGQLHKLGWIEGQTVALEYRWAEGRSERFADIATEFVRLRVDVIVTGGVAVPAAKQGGDANSVSGDKRVGANVKRVRSVRAHT
jgi:hypothetical protein